jgi:uncharacterized OB-fold protein
LCHITPILGDGRATLPLAVVEVHLTNANPNEVKIGQRVEMVIRKLRAHGEEGMIVYGYKFRPMTDGS